MQRKKKNINNRDKWEIKEKKHQKKRAKEDTKKSRRKFKQRRDHNGSEAYEDEYLG
jgi:hypothetical protein